MLADDLVADRYLPKIYPGIDPVLRSIGEAQKFVLERDFALAADGLVENHKELFRIAPFCRLPYGLSWFEFAFADRTHWINADMHYPEVQSRPQRVGFLCEAQDATMTKWTAYLCWSLRETKIGPYAVRRNVSVLCIEFDLTRPATDLADYIHVKATPFLPDELPMTQDVAQEFTRIMQSDWAGEIRYLFSVLGLLNSRNVVEQTATNYAKLNRARERRGQLPMYEHKVLKIRAVHRPSLVPGLKGAERSGEIRSHFVRGHFKIRATGTFWWGPHMRGRLDTGHITKDYVVTT